MGKQVHVYRDEIGFVEENLVNLIERTANQEEELLLDEAATRVSYHRLGFLRKDQLIRGVQMAEMQ